MLNTCVVEKKNFNLAQFKTNSFEAAKRINKNTPSKFVYICSPLRGNVEANMAKARIYCRFAYDNGFVPLCPHIYFPQFLDDEKPKERADGLLYGLYLTQKCEQLWVFGSYISMGMEAEIKLAKSTGIPVRYFNESLEEIHGRHI